MITQCKKCESTSFEVEVEQTYFATVSAELNDGVLECDRSEIQDGHEETEIDTIRCAECGAIYTLDDFEDYDI